MWTSLKKIEQPESLEIAYQLARHKGTEILSGGSYLSAGKNPEIHTLVDISHLITSSIREDENKLIIGAGITLQELFTNLSGEKDTSLHLSIHHSCPSKNIRNQRTLGGEIAQNRINSELLLLLIALEAELSVTDKMTRQVQIADWNHKGIITDVRIQRRNISKSKILRIAPLPSAPASVIVARTKHDDHMGIVCGGAAGDYFYQHFFRPLSTNDIQVFSSSASENFKADHHGSLDYKKQVISQLVKDIVGGSCR